MKKIFAAFGVIGNGIGYIFFSLLFLVMKLIAFITTSVFVVWRAVTKFAFPLGIFATFYVVLTHVYQDTLINSAKLFFSSYDVISKQMLLLVGGSVIIGGIVLMVFSFILSYADKIRFAMVALKDKTENAMLQRKSDIKKNKQIVRYGSINNSYEAEFEAFRRSSNFISRF